jgi:hypothetical protein
VENKTRPKSYASQVQTLKRIKSELETIQEKKEDAYMDQQMMENIMVDESYSFSLRQFEKQVSKKDLPVATNFDGSRLSNMSINGAAGELYHAPGSQQRNSSSKLNGLGNSGDYGPFSKRRAGDQR